MKKVILVSSSLAASSRSAILIEATAERLKEKGHEAVIVDLREEEIPFCDGRPLEEYSDRIQTLYKDLSAADRLVLASPIYCSSISGVMKNFLDIFMHSMKGKRFGVCAALGSKLSYMAIADLYRIMSFQANATGVQPSVVVDNADFEDNQPKPDIHERIDRMLSELLA